MALSGATVRVLDATGKVVVTGSAVAANGSYGPIALTGTGPFRVEACGYAAGKFRCVYTVSALGGTAHATPLTSAAVLLATSQTPEAWMAATAATGPDASSLATAQTQLRNALSAALTDAGLSSSADFFTSTITAGSRTGYDRLLDNIGLSYGSDGAKVFVQATPRLGSGNVYLEPGTTQGTLSIAAGAAALNLAGIDSLYTAINGAMATSAACDANMTALMASNARLAIENGPSFKGPDNVSLGLCSMLSGLLGDGLLPFGSVLQAPELGRCELSGLTGTPPVCKVSLVARTSKGLLRVWLPNQAVSLESGNWRFLGDMQVPAVYAQASLQRSRRVDGATPVDSYARLLSVSIPATAGIACTRVSQTDLSGQDQTLAYYKTHPGGLTMSVWSVDAVSNVASLSPTTGATRSTEDRAFPLAIGADGDAIVRNFYRSGRSIKVSLYSDSACSSPFTPTNGNGSSFSVDLPGVPPLSSELAAQPWPVLASASATSLTALKGAAKAKISYTGNWTFARETLGMDVARLCTDAACAAPIGELLLSANPRTAVLAATVGNTALADNAFKQLRLVGRNADGLLIYSDYQSCPAATAGQACP